MPFSPENQYFLPDYFFSSEVQFGHRVALTGIWVEQKGHSFVAGVGAGAGAAAASFAFWRALICAIGRTTRKNTTAAMITKVMIVLMKLP
jgi:hypothetical protein